MLSKPSEPLASRTDRPRRPGTLHADSLATIVANDASAPEQILARLIEVCPFSIIVVEAFGKIVLANSETERMFGYARDELIGQTVDLLAPPDYAANMPGTAANSQCIPG